MLYYRRTDDHVKQNRVKLSFPCGLLNQTALNSEIHSVGGDAVKPMIGTDLRFSKIILQGSAEDGFEGVT